MAEPWQTLAQAETSDGPLELRRRGELDFLITLRGRVLMNSRANRSELALAELACAALAGRVRPRLLIGGLGMGCTLRAALDGLPAEARIEVREINPAVLAWCRGPLSALNRDALGDARVEVAIGDVAKRVAELAAGGGGRGEPAPDAILLDLYEGPHAGSRAADDPFYGTQALRAAWRALAPGGVLAVWSEDPDTGFERRLAAAGFAAERRRPGRGGRRHAVYLARRLRA